MSYTEEDAEKIIGILGKGGKIFLHPDDFKQMTIIAIAKGMFNVVDKMVSSPMVEKGTMIAAAGLEYDI